MNDLISRQAAIEVLEWFDQTDPLGHTPGQIVRALPTAEPRKGKWIEHNPHKWGLGIVYECDQCGEKINCETSNYCPNCGARMEE